jgi:hypothetical protein
MSVKIKITDETIAEEVSETEETIKIKIVTDEPTEELLEAEEQPEQKVKIKITNETPEDSDLEDIGEKVKIRIVKDNEKIVKIEVVDKNKIEGELILRSSLNGDLMILDHKDIDIIIKQKDGKVITFAKEMMSDMSYGAGSRLMEYLRHEGVIEYDSIQGGNIHGSMESKIQEGSKRIPITLFKVYEWMKKEKPAFEAREEYDEEIEDHMLDPDNEYSTELGQVPQRAQKGSIRQHNMFAPYLYGRYTF